MRKTGFFYVIKIIGLCASLGIFRTRTVRAEEAENLQKIRVLLMDTSYQTYYHPTVTVSWDGKEYTYEPGDWEFTEGPVILHAEDGICVKSISRQGASPVYEGALEIHSTDRGLLLINELLLETYLEAVVPSEMPSSYEKEALKAQAVCARTYAWKQMRAQTLSEYGADVDDSVNFQVYRNVPPQETTSAAVAETRGQVLIHQGELIEAYYFSTSSGTTSTDEVWGLSEASAYLKSVPCAFDGESPWSSWTAEFPWQTLSERAGELAGCSGTLHSLAVMKKSQSGAATQLCVYTEGGVGVISTEYDIRAFFAPQGIEIMGKEGSLSKGGALLPSAYFELTVEPQKFVRITGRGYGHGVGMSQEAANVMAQEGYEYPEILDYFFQDIEIRNMETGGDVLP